MHQPCAARRRHDTWHPVCRGPCLHVSTCDSEASSKSALKRQHLAAAADLARTKAKQVHCLPGVQLPWTCSLCAGQLCADLEHRPAAGRGPSGVDHMRGAVVTALVLLLLQRLLQMWLAVERLLLLARVHCLLVGPLRLPIHRPRLALRAASTPCKPEKSSISSRQAAAIQADFRYALTLTTPTRRASSPEPA